MCGRFAFTSENRITGLRFGIDLGDFPVTHSFNIAPTQNVLALVGTDKGRKPTTFRWGLIPSWSKEKAIGAKMINARSETLTEKPSFREAFKRRRCLILADGFYEWKQTPEGKIPHLIRLKSHEPFAFAGLYDTWNSPEGNETLHTCTIITTEPNELMAPIHSRMPVITTPAEEDAWLDPSNQDTKTLQGILKPYTANEMEAFAVSKAVNSVRNTGAECVEKVFSI